MSDVARLPSPARARIRVPCSTSNLGPGFDLIGLALSLFVEVECTPETGRSGHVLELGAGTGDWPDSSDNLLLVGFERGRREAGGAAHARCFRVTSRIPVSRGLGSSSSAVVAGLLLGAACGPHLPPRERLLELGLEIEGHPDNVAPALLGGCVLSLPLEGGPVRCVRQALHRSLAFAVAWPAATLQTRAARALLPAQVDFRAAVENPRRLALLLEGLRTGERELIELGSQDRLHVPYRLPKVPSGSAAIAAARAAGAWMATISGSGSGLFFIADANAIASVARAAEAELERASPPAQSHVLEAVESAPQVELLD